MRQHSHPSIANAISVGGISPFQLPLLFIFLVASSLDSNNDGKILPFVSAENIKSSWYKRYPSYPEYCSTPDEMKARAIPNLQEDTNHAIFGETRLLHVTAVIRHGARTPYSSTRYDCWDGYWDNAETGIWDCTLTTLMAPPAVTSIEKEEGLPETINDDLAFFLFEKKYDALSYPADRLTNELNGTCQVGQLLLQGYEQEIMNGKLLREAYLYEHGSYDHDERMRLIDVNYQLISNMNDMPWNQVRYRCDDDQRTVMSGQVLLRGMFDDVVLGVVYETGRYPIIHTHTADRSQDILAPNHDICPKLNILYDNALQSEEFQSYNNSEHVNKTREFILQNLGKNTNDDDLLDCLMTTICTDRPLPDAVDDFGKVGSRFEQTAEMHVRSYTKAILHNNAEYSKVAMAPLWTEIMDNIRPFLDDNVENQKDSAPRLAIFAGHDTTIMPLLASLGPNMWNETDWPPYASMVLIEIHELIDGRASTSVYTSNYAFRLLYNGKILTYFVKGCPQDAELCDIVHLLALVDPMTNSPPDCSVPDDYYNNDDDGKFVDNIVVEKTQALMSTKQGIFLFIGLVIISAIAGAVSTFVFLTGRFPCTSGSGRSNSRATAEERRGVLDGNDDEEDGFDDEPTMGVEDSFVNGGNGR